MRRLRDRTIVPPTSFRYTHETGYTTVASTYADWVSSTKDHFRANDLPVPLDLEAQMNEQLCGILPPTWCDRDPGDVKWVDTHFGWNDFVDGMKAFGRWAVGGVTFVEQEEADRRAAICVSCPLNVNITGCAACHKMATAITGDVAKKHSAYDDYLRACAICHCALKAMVWFPIDTLQSNETPERQTLRPDFCWVKQGGENYEQTAATSVRGTG